MANEIKLKRGSGSDPSASDLAIGEPAIRTDTGEIFLKKDDNSVAKISGGGISDGDKGDITVSSSGSSFTIDNGVITDAKVASNAAISASKISGVMPTTGGAFTGNVSISDNAIEFDSDSGNTNKVSLQGPSSLSSDVTFTLPNTDGSASGEVLKTDGSGNLSFGVADKIEEGNSKVEVVDSGSGYVTTEVDGNEEIRTIAGQTTIKHLRVGENWTMADATGNGISIFTSNSNDLIKSTGTNGFKIRAAAIQLLQTGSPNNIYASFNNTQCDFRVNGSQKLAVTSSGASLTGNLAATGNVSGAALSGTSLLITSANPKIELTDSDGDDYSIDINGGIFNITDETATTTRFSIATDGQVSIAGKLNCNGGLDTDGDVQFNSGTTNMNVLFDASEKQLDFDDNVKISFGSGSSSFKIFSDGTDSIIQSYQEGEIKIRHSTDAGGNVKDSIKAIADGAVQLFHNGNQKLATASGGVSITGTLTASSTITTSGNIFATNDSQQDIGTTSIRFANGFFDTLYGDGSNLTGINTDLVSDTSPQLGGDLDTNSFEISLDDAHAVKFGDSNDLQIMHSTHNYIYTSNGNIELRSTVSSDEAMIKCKPDDAVELYYNGSLKLATANDKINFYAHAKVNADSTYDLGASGARWANAYVDTYYGSGANLTSLNASNISSGTIAAARVGDISGNAASADTVDVTGASNQNASFMPTFVDNTGSAKTIKVDGNLTYNPSTNVLSTGTFSGSGASLTSLNASNISSGTISASRVPTLNQNTTGSSASCTGNAATASNAATLDGIDSSQFVRSDASDTLTGSTYTLNSSTAQKIILQGSNIPYIHFKEGTTDKAYIQWHSDGFFRLVNQEDSSQLRLQDDIKFSYEGSTFYKIWHGGNDGVSSGLDADLLDGKHDTSFLRSDAGGGSASYNATQDITFSGGASAVTVAANSDIRLASGNWTGNAYAKIQHHASRLYIAGGSSSDYSITLRYNSGDKIYMRSNGTFYPASNASSDLGTSSKRWNNLYVNDLQLSNENTGGNSVDGTWGDWTLQEAEDTIFMLNNRNGKKYKMNLTEVS